MRGISHSDPWMSPQISLQIDAGKVAMGSSNGKNKILLSLGPKDHHLDRGTSHIIFHSLGKIIQNCSFYVSIQIKNVGHSLSISAHS